MSKTTRAPSAATEAWQLLGELWHDQRRNFLSAAQEFDLSPPQVLALRGLDPEEPRAMTVLAGILHCDNSNITGIVDRLETRGLVERRAAAHDRRVKHLVLTPAGVTMREAIGARMDRAPEALEQLSAEDQRTLRDVLRRALGAQ